MSEVPQPSRAPPTAPAQQVGEGHAARRTPGTTLKLAAPPKTGWNPAPPPQLPWHSEGTAALACFQEGRGQLGLLPSYLDAGQPGIARRRDDLGMAEALWSRAAPLCAHCAQGFWAQRQAWLCPNMATGRGHWDLAGLQGRSR